MDKMAGLHGWRVYDCTWFHHNIMKNFITKSLVKEEATSGTMEVYKRAHKTRLNQHYIGACHCTNSGKYGLKK